MSTKLKDTARDRILQTASKLFYSRGINSTGIDLIIAESKVAKASLYNNFASKEELIAAYLEKLRCDFEESLEAEISNRGDSLTLPFDLLERSLLTGEFFGCPFTNALTELPDSRLVRNEVAKYRDKVADYFRSQLEGDSSKTDQLMIVYDGAFTSCKLEPDVRRVQIAKSLARRIAQL